MLYMSGSFNLMEADQKDPYFLNFLRCNNAVVDLQGRGIIGHLTDHWIWNPNSQTAI